MKILKVFYGLSIFVLLSQHTLSLAQRAENNAKIPEGMVLISGSRTSIGSNEGPDNEKPSFQTFVNSFLLDIRPITVAEFRLFTKINRYITDAEKAGKAPVFDAVNKEWKNVEGAYWEYPQGKNTDKAENNEPVRQISWNDAQAYAKWIGKRLPSEFELEFASQQLNKYPLIQNLDGNLWQWCDTWYAPYDDYNYYSKQLNRQKTLKGGNITAELQDSKVAFRTSARSSALPQTFSYQIGFRCARDL